MCTEECHGRQTVEWLQKRPVELLPCPHFHMIATVLSQLHGLFQRHQKILYGLLLQSAARALCELLTDRHYLGAEPGILAVLHCLGIQVAIVSLNSVKSEHIGCVQIGIKSFA